jgi:hypothetical protein
MTKPQLKAVSVADDRHPPPTPFITDAEREGLATVNVTTDTGAPVLDVDGVLRRTVPDYGKENQ